MNIPAPTSRRAGLSTDVVLDAATTLSEKEGIHGWSIRDIAKKLGVVPSVIYHYYPNKDALCDAVVDRVYKEISLPDPELEWKEWFTQRAFAFRRVLLRYHGVSDRLVRGRFPASSLAGLDMAFRKLEEAGFKEEAPVVATMLMNTILHAVFGRNIRAPQQKTDRHSLEAMIEGFDPMLETSLGLRRMVESFLRPLSDPEREDELSDHYFELLIRVTLSGLERELLSTPPAAS